MATSIMSCSSLRVLVPSAPAPLPNQLPRGAPAALCQRGHLHRPLTPLETKCPCKACEGQGARGCWCPSHILGFLHRLHPQTCSGDWRDPLSGLPAAADEEPRLLGEIFSPPPLIRGDLASTSHLTLTSYPALYSFLTS